MKQIKTVQFKVNDFEGFDKTVNECLADGWTLTDRFRTEQYEGELYTSFAMYVAFLEKEIPNEAGQIDALAEEIAEAVNA